MLPRRNTKRKVRESSEDQQSDRLRNEPGGMLYLIFLSILSQLTMVSLGYSEKKAKKATQQHGLSQRKTPLSDFVSFFFLTKLTFRSEMPKKSTRIKVGMDAPTSPDQSNPEQLVTPTATPTQPIVPETPESLSPFRGPSTQQGQNAATSSSGMAISQYHHPSLSPTW
jgi:hypothetical protein